MLTLDVWLRFVLILRVGLCIEAPLALRWDLNSSFSLEEREKSIAACFVVLFDLELGLNLSRTASSWHVLMSYISM